MSDKEIRCLVAPLVNSRVLLPNSAVAEILNFTSPEPFKRGPSWLLGEMDWRGWKVPVISYEQLASAGDSRTITSKTRILIIKTLGESTQLNYIGLVIQGLPQLKKVTASGLVDKKTEGLPESVFSEVTIDDITAFIPELAGLTHSVEQAAYET